MSFSKIIAWFNQMTIEWLINTREYKWLSAKKKSKVEGSKNMPLFRRRGAQPTISRHGEPSGTALQKLLALWSSFFIFFISK